MKILQVVNSFKYAWSAGGAARVAYDLSLGLTKNGHSVMVFTTDKGLDSTHFNKNQSILLDGMEVYYFKNLSRFLANKGFSIPYYSPFIIRNKIKNSEIIHIHELRRIINIPIYYYARRYKIPYIIHAHGAVFPNKRSAKKFLGVIFDSLFTRRFLKSASKIIALTNNEVEQYMAFGINKEKIAVIPNGIDLSQCNNFLQRGLFRKKYSIADNIQIILFIGRIAKIKGIDLLVRAFANVVQTLNNVLLVIIGPDYGFLSTVRALISVLKIGDKVLITGPLYEKDKFEAYIDASIVVVPSRYEIFGMVVLESYACSTPVIGSRVGGLQEIVSHGKTGLLVKQGAVDELSSALEIILNNNDLRNKLALNAKKYVECNFSINRIVDSLEATYVKILES